MAEEGRMLIEYVTMNAIAIRKILKKYDKVCTNLVHFYLLIFLLGLCYLTSKTKLIEIFWTSILGALLC
jgi:Ni,Fe-hydrogenase I large subunit